MTTSPFLRLLRVALAVVLIGGPALAALLADSAEVRIKAAVVLVLFVVAVFAAAQAVRDLDRPIVVVSATLGGRPATHVPMRRWSHQALLAVVVAVGVTPLVLVAPDPLAMLGIAVLLSPLYLMVPDLVRLSRSRLGVWLSEEDIEIESWSHVGRLSWDDVDSATTGVVGGGAVLVVTAAPHVEGFPRRRYWIYRFRRAAPAGSLAFPLYPVGADLLQLADAIVGAVDDPSLRARFGRR